MTDAAVWLGVAALGMAGALGRFWLDRWVERHQSHDFPLGTLTVNLLGTFCLGALAGAALPQREMLLFGTGLLGAFTTFSTWMFESQRLVEEARDWMAILNLAVSLGGGALALLAGWAVGAAL